MAFHVVINFCVSFSSFSWHPMQSILPVNRKRKQTSASETEKIELHELLFTEALYMYIPRHASGTCSVVVNNNITEYSPQVPGISKL